MPLVAEFKPQPAPVQPTYRRPASVVNKPVNTGSRPFGNFLQSLSNLSTNFFNTNSQALGTPVQAAAPVVPITNVKCEHGKGHWCNPISH